MTIAHKKTGKVVNNIELSFFVKIFAVYLVTQYLWELLSSLHKPVCKEGKNAPRSIKTGCIST
jgi:hypothetical protein